MGKKIREKQEPTHLLILRLFFLEPNKPCKTKIGESFSSLAVGFAGTWWS